MSNDGGPAFPVWNNAEWEYNYIKQGMSLRDWLAGQALAGMNLHHSYNPQERKSAALCAYLIADEMLDVRSKTP